MTFPSLKKFLPCVDTWDLREDLVDLATDRRLEPQPPWKLDTVSRPCDDRRGGGVEEDTPSTVTLSNGRRAMTQASLFLTVGSVEGVGGGRER